MMVLSLCGGSPGEKDELNPGNGSTGPHVTALEKAADAETAASANEGGKVEGASAQDDTHGAAEAALQVRIFCLYCRIGGGGCWKRRSPREGILGVESGGTVF